MYLIEGKTLGDSKVIHTQIPSIVFFLLFTIAQAFYKLAMNLAKISILLFRYDDVYARDIRVVLTTVPPTYINVTVDLHVYEDYAIANDVLNFVLPTLHIYQAQLPSSQKLVLMAVFALRITRPPPTSEDPPSATLSR
ncbi:hypothetical protein SLS62_000784 [Diatrype stigma]|uniref:Uncharacterized protein n=1 Tax=Diatrype stigma TaxID=117547 RepID=A0AAN9YXB5_9PEZI